MDLSELRSKIEGRSARLAVIGLGYVGLPVACQFARSGFNVLGIELREEVIDQINRGTSPIEGKEPGLAELLGEVIASGRLSASSDYTRLRQHDVVIICVETPVDEDHIPRYDALRSVLENLRPNLKTGALVIVESTLAPGTMDRLVLPALEAGRGLKLDRDFYLGHCPERVMPGRLLANLEHMSRVVGGMTPGTARTMAALYRNIVNADLDATDCITAELVKTTENTYRDVQIAFANEVALICEAVGGDVWKVRELVNKSPYRNMHLPGAGVGGHCIPKDPWLLAHAVRETDVPLRLIPAARAVNDSMPLHMVELLEDALKSQGLELKGAKVLVLGYAYLEDSDDTRNSPSQALVQRLRELGAQVVVHDPFVGEYRGDVYQRAEGCDAVVIMVKHNEYRQLDFLRLKSLLRLPILIDGRAVIDARLLRDLGYLYRVVGQ